VREIDHTCPAAQYETAVRGAGLYADSANQRRADIYGDRAGLPTATVSIVAPNANAIGWVWHRAGIDQLAANPTSKRPVTPRLHNTRTSHRGSAANGVQRTVLWAAKVRGALPDPCKRESK